MKKHRIARETVPVNCSIFMTLLGATMIPIFISAYRNGVVFSDLAFPALMGLICLFFGFFYLFLDRPLGKCSVDEESITMYRGLRTRRFRWEEIIESDIVCALKNGKETFWVYFSTKRLTEEERKDFLKKGRKDVESVAYFQYDRKLLQEAMQYMPNRFAEKLNYKRMTLCLG